MEAAFAAFDNIIDEPDEDYTQAPDTSAEEKQIVPDTNYIPCADDPSDRILISKSGAFISFDDIAYAQKKGVRDDVSHMKAVRKIENYFTLKTMQIIGVMKQTKRCKVDKKKKRIIVPRFGIFEVLNDKYGLDSYTTKSCIKAGESPSEWFRWKADLKPNQQLIVNYMMKNIYTNERKMRGSAGCILNLEAGQGKSYLAAYMMSKFNRRQRSSSIVQV